MIKNLLSGIIQKLPLFSGLVQCNLKNHKEALMEFGITVLGSTIPLTVGAFVMCVIRSNNIQYLDALKKIAGGGELLLYATSLLSPILFMALYDPKGAKEFPTKLSHTLTLIVIIMLSACVFSLDRSGLELNMDLIFPISIFCFLASICLLYLAIVYKNNRMSVGPEDFKRPEIEFKNAFFHHR